MQRAAAFGLIAALLLAGCLGSSTPAPPEGLSEEGIEDLDALYGAHEDRLDGASYAVRSTNDLGNASDIQRRVILQRFGADGDYHAEERTVRTTGTQTAEIWRGGNATDAFMRRPTATPGEYRVVAFALGPQAEPFRVDFANRTRGYLDGMLADSDQSVSYENGNYTVTVRPNASSVRFDLTVAPDGLIRRFALEENVSSIGTSTVVETWIVDEVAPPDWVDDARDEAGNTTVPAWARALNDSATTNGTDGDDTSGGDGDAEANATGNATAAG